MRLLLALIAVMFLTAAGPEDDWKALLKAGKDKEALAQIEKAGKAGDARALDWLGWFYDTGRAVTADKARAADYYRQAADKGDANAQWRLGVMLDTGEGVPLDSTAAMGWFRKSAAQDYSNAYASMGVMYSSGRGVDRDFGKALDCYRQAAKLHNIHAFNEIGIVYYAGEGVPPDKVEAMAYFIIAAMHGDSGAKNRMQMVASELDGDGIKRATDRANVLSKEYNLEGKPDTSGLTT